MPINKVAHKKKEEEKNTDESGYQYNDSKYHPVEEYLSTTVEKLTSDTPSFVLEVTWPRVALFYHPASPLCLELRDVYVKRAREIRRRSTKIPVEFWAVSCQVHRDACEDLGVLAVPRVLGYPKGSIEGKIIPRTRKNDLRIQDMVEQIGIVLQEEKEDEVERKELEFEKKQQQQLYNDAALLDGNLRGGSNNNQGLLPEEDHLHAILHPHSKLKDVYADAMTSLLLSLDNNLERGGYEWTADKYHAFCEWIDLMHWTLPTRDMALVHNIVGDIRNNYDKIATNPKELIRILQSHDYYDMKRTWSPSCQQPNPEDHGFACGFWKLLHVMSIGVAEQHKHVLGDVHRVVVSHVQSVVLNYVKEFGFASSKAGKKEIVRAYKACLQSEECKDEMGITTDDNENNDQGGLWNRFRNQRPTNIVQQEADDEHPAAVWRSLGLWLWKAHQSYRNKRLEHQQMQNSALGIEDLQWPPAALCPKCYASGIVHHGSGGIGGANDDEANDDDHHIQDETTNIIWNKEQVFEHLKREYWPKTLQSPRVVVLDRLWKRQGGGGMVVHYLSSSTQQEVLLHASGLLALLIFLAITYHQLQQQRHQRISGRHKKRDRLLRMTKGNNNSRRTSRNNNNNNNNRRFLLSTSRSSSYDSSEGDCGYAQYSHVDDSSDDGVDLDDRSYLGLTVASAVRRNPAPARRRTNHQSSRIPLAFINES